MKFSEISKFRLADLRAELKKRGVEALVLKQNKQPLVDYLIRLLKSSGEFEDDSDKCTSIDGADCYDKENGRPEIEDFDVSVKTEEMGAANHGLLDVSELAPRPSLREQLTEQDASEVNDKECNKFLGL